MMSNVFSLATNLLGRRVRLRERPQGAQSDTGRITTLYVDAEGLHYVVLVEGRLVHVENGNQLTVLEDDDW
jgi:hypothetical protein